MCLIHRNLRYTQYTHMHDDKCISCVCMMMMMMMMMMSVYHVYGAGVVPASAGEL